MLTDTIFEKTHFDDSDIELNQIYTVLIWTGIVATLLGAAAILLPFIATITIQTLIAIVLIGSGALHLFYTYKSGHADGLFFRLAGSFLYLVTGIVLIAFPLKGALALTIVLAFLFIFAGVFRIALALALNPYHGWKWVLAHGVLSLILGLLIWFALPGAASWVIGLLVGIELFLSGCTMIMYALSLKDRRQQCNLQI